MTQDKKEDLNAKFLRHSLTETERAELADAINTDSEFREAIRFDLGVAEAIERERYDIVEQARLASENSVRQRKRCTFQKPQSQPPGSHPKKDESDPQGRFLNFTLQR